MGGFSSAKWLFLHGHILLSIGVLFRLFLSRVSKSLSGELIAKMMPIVSDEHYDLIVDYGGQQLLYYMVNKLRATRKITFFHNDYSKWSYYYNADKKYYPKVDNIFSISKICIDVLKKYLTSDEFKLYSLIYKRVLASLMGDAKVKQTTCLFDNNSYIFKTVGSVVVFDGYLKVYRDYEEENQEEIPEIVTDKIYKSNEIIPEQHFTKPPARYSEAKLIKTLEEDGIGRPSTYATIIDTIKSRGYVDLVKKVFIPTSDGILATDKLQEAFSDIINVEYTKNMEDDLDSVATGDAVWNKVLEDFYNLFEDRIASAFTTMEKKKAEEVGELCPNCSSPLVKRHGKYGDFIACSNYPTCKYIKKEEKEVVEKKPILVCPNCGGNIIEKTTRRGKIFYGCDNFPKCKVATWDLPVRVEGKKLIVKDKNGEEKVLDI